VPHRCRRARCAVSPAPAGSAGSPASAPPPPGAAPLREQAAPAPHAGAAAEALAAAVPAGSAAGPYVRCCVRRSLSHGNANLGAILCTLAQQHQQQQSIRDPVLTCQSSILASMATAAQPGDARCVAIFCSVGGGFLRLHRSGRVRMSESHHAESPVHVVTCLRSGTLSMLASPPGSKPGTRPDGCIAQRRVQDAVVHEVGAVVRGIALPMLLVAVDLIERIEVVLRDIN